ncbi:MAG: hypothetical protein AB2374_14075 [Cytobacillus gottheilii]|uniref:hypothetical protein n=1 Tax=Cytobacillus gottheilii TaxID=859144 RepID=UPI00082D6B87|nr:hypothetical protein [Cytobacillus gottheilii]
MDTLTKSYVDFFQKSIIPLPAFKMKNNSISCSHWLIAIEGKLEKKKNYSWRVAVYPSSEIGNFEWNDLVYQSERFDSFNSACAHARETEELYKKVN